MDVVGFLRVLQFPPTGKVDMGGGGGGGGPNPISPPEILAKSQSQLDFY